MAIVYTATQGQHSIDGSSIQAFGAELKTILETYNWTVTQQALTSSIKFLSTPSNNHTITWVTPTATRVYTFKTTLTGAADEVLIGGSTSAATDNLRRALNNDGVAGTNYGTGTTQNADLSAAVNGGDNTQLDLTQRTTDIAYGNGWTVAYSVTSVLRVIMSSGNQTAAGTTTYACFEAGGWLAITPAGLDNFVCNLWLGRWTASYEDSVNFTLHPAFSCGAGATVIPFSAATGGNPALYVTGGRTFRALVSEQTLAIFIVGSFNAYSGEDFFFFVPKALEVNEPFVISSATDSGGLVKITTSAAHGLATNDVVWVSSISFDGEYDASLEDEWTITVVDTTSFTLNGSTFPGGTHDAGTGTVGLSTTQTVQALVVHGNAYHNLNSTGALGDAIGSFALSNSFRKQALVYQGTSSFQPGLRAIVQWNGSRIVGGTYTPDVTQLSFTLPWMSRAVAAIPCVGGFGVLVAPMIVAPTGAWADANLKLLGYAPNCFVTSYGTAGDTTQTHDGHTWYCITNNSTYGNLWISKGETA